MSEARYEDGQWVAPCPGCNDDVATECFDKKVKPTADQTWCSRCWKDEKIRRLEAKIKELEGHKVSERDRDEDMWKLADAFFENLQRDNCEYGGWGVDPKRPFGNSDVDNDILEIIGYEARECPHCNEPIGDDDDEQDPQKYAASLYDDLGKFLQDKWSEFRGRKGEKSPLYCEHANEFPMHCTCPPDCYCKDHSCKHRKTK